MKRMVIDKNMFERDELRAWLAESKDHVAIVTDYGQLEMLKGNALVNILKSTEIVSAFSKQVHVLKPITMISGIKGKRKGMKKRLTSGGGTRSFRKWCKKRARAALDMKLQQHSRHGRAGGGAARGHAGRYERVRREH
jgi:hypothetical protein